MDRPPRPRDPSLPSIAATGFGATIAQILLLRELLVLFYGNEMSAALVLAGWLLWTALGSAVAARRASRCDLTPGTFAGLLALLAVAVPATIALVRGARWVFGIPLGELGSLGEMVLVCMTVPILVCPAAGALFGLCWAYRQRTAGSASPASPLTVYLGEALGAALGGSVFFFLLLRVTTALSAAMVVSTLLLATSAWVLWTERGGGSGWLSRAGWGVSAAALLVAAVWHGRLDSLSRRWQWGDHLAAARDTPYHHIAILSQPDQTTVFANGLWLFTWPDPMTTELAVDLPLLLHPEPERILLLGGGIAGQVSAALRHPGVERVAYLEQDPTLISFSEPFLSPSVRASFRDARVRIHSQDAGSFLRRQRGGEYDVILMNVGDPINAQMNRFYTEELFRRIARHLRAEGIFTFSVAGGGNVIGPAHARFLGSLHRTLRRVFEQVVVLPGQAARFVAKGGAAPLVLDAGILAARIGDRRLDLTHLSRDTLEELLSPFRIDYLRSVLAELGESSINRQFSPICYQHALTLWAAQWNPALEELVAGAVAVPPALLWWGLMGAALLVTASFWSGRRRFRTAVGASVVVQGAWSLVLQVVLILSYQILQGSAYLQLALIIALFMAGLAVGAACIVPLGASRRQEARSVQWLLAVQVAVTAIPLLLALWFSPALVERTEGLPPPALSLLFSLASGVAGLLAGAHFSLAALACRAAGGSPERTGGYLYALDLAGAAGGAFTGGLFLLPVFGVRSVLVLLSGMSLVCLLGLLRRPRFE